mgnify:CR=1 FL=1
MSERISDWVVVVTMWGWLAIGVMELAGLILSTIFYDFPVAPVAIIVLLIVAVFWCAVRSFGGLRNFLLLEPEELMQ